MRPETGRAERPPVEDDRCCPTDLSLAVGAITSCPPRLLPAALLIQERAAAAATDISSFIEGTVIYVLSQQWDDLISIYLLRLHSVPFCGSNHRTHTAPNCTPEASAATQLRYVGGLLLVSAALQSYAEIGAMPYRWQLWRHQYGKVVPRMIGMCIGWALGNTFRAAFLQIDTRTRGRISSDTCTSFCNLSNVLFCSALTFATAVAMLISQPLAADHVSCGLRTWQIALGYYLKTTLLLLINGLATSIKIVWTFSFKSFLTWGISPSQQGTVLFERALILWAVALTFCFAALTVLVRRWRDRAEARGSHAAAARAAAPDAPAHLMEWRHALFAYYFELLEATMGWTVGCAWTDALVAFTPLGDNAVTDTGTTLGAVGVASAFTLLGCTWLIISGQSIGGSGAKKADEAKSDSSVTKVRPRHAEATIRSQQRSHVEAAFATNAFIFSVGWSWVVVLRDGSALAFLYVTVAADIFASRRASELVGFLTQATCVFFLGPGLTVVVLYAKERLRPFEAIEDTLRGRKSESSTPREPNPLSLL